MNNHIEDKSIHLEDERNNLYNLGTSILYYYYEEDDGDDYTNAFRLALTNSKRVYVPGGTYKITGALIIPEDCELELAQDAVLDFQPKIWNSEPENFKCITLERSSRLLGNHAAICVPYSYKGNVLYSTDDGFRYLKDINIIKLIESGDNAGLPASEDKVTNGTALLIERIEPDDDSDLSVLDRLNFSGLGIMGAFDYGVRCINTENAVSTNRHSEARIVATIDGCRTAVYMNQYSDVHISAIIQPRLAYMSTSNQENPRYAECGIHLVNSINIDLRDSRIRNWDSIGEAWSFSNEFQHVCLEGDCYGLSLDHSLCHGIDGYKLRDMIHSNIPDNHENMTVFEEPSTDYFNYHGENAVEGLLYRDVKINSDDKNPHYKPGDLMKTTGTTSTCLIPCTKNSTILVKDFGFDDSTDTPSRIAFYKEDGGCIGVFNHSLFDDLSLMNYVPAESKIELTGKTALNGVVCFRFCFNSDKLGLKPAVIVRETDGNTITKETTIYLKDGCLKDRTCFKAQYIYGLEKYIEDYLNSNQ